MRLPLLMRDVGADGRERFDYKEPIAYLNADFVPAPGDVITTHSDELDRALREVRVVRRHFVVRDAAVDWEQVALFLIVEPNR